MEVLGDKIGEGWRDIDP